MWIVVDSSMLVPCSVTYLQCQAAAGLCQHHPGDRISTPTFSSSSCWPSGRRAWTWSRSTGPASPSSSSRSGTRADGRTTFPAYYAHLVALPDMYHIIYKEHNRDNTNVFDVNIEKAIKVYDCIRNLMYFALYAYYSTFGRGGGTYLAHCLGLQWQRLPAVLFMNNQQCLPCCQELLICLIRILQIVKCPVKN